MSKRFIPIQALNPSTSAGTWAYTTASNLTALVKTPAANTSVVSFSLPRDLSGAYNPPGITQVSINWTTGVAALSSAPTLTVNKVVIDPSTRAVSRSAVTPALSAISGTDTTGTATGDFTFNASFHPTTLDDTSAYTFEISFVAAATSTLKVSGVEITYA